MKASYFTQHFYKALNNVQNHKIKIYKYTITIHFFYKIKNISVQ